VEFLTKTPAYNPAHPDSTQDFYYEIRMKDSKGDTDSASKTFEVRPDAPPAAAISLDSAFLRTEGTNIADIKTEDVTVAADGDEVERIWYYGQGASPSVFTNAAALSGYQKLSFGTDKIVGFHQTGVGKFAVKLLVKEKWTEPTLEEYVAEADRLTGAAIVYSDVQNVAPVVSLEMLKGTEKEILLLANGNAEYQKLLDNKTALQQALLASKIDGRIIIKKLIGGTPGTVTGVSEQRRLSYPYGPTVRHGSTLATEAPEGKLVAVDSENTYFLTYTWVNGSPTAPMTVHAIDPYLGEVWSYTTNRTDEFYFGQDDTGKYLYLIYSSTNQTVLLDKRTGTAAGTVNIALPQKVSLSDNLAFSAEGGSLSCIDLNTLTKTVIANGVSAVSRVCGKLQYIAYSRNAIVRCKLDMETLQIEKSIIVAPGKNVSSTEDYVPVCIDSAGKAVFWKYAGAGTDAFAGVRAYGADNKLIREIAVPNVYGGGTAVYYSLDEEGNCNHVMVWERYTPTSPDKHALTGVNLSTGSVGRHTKATNAYFQDFAGAFESNGTSYFLFNGWYMYPGAIDYYGNNYTFSFNGASCGMGVLGPATFGSLEENMQVSDRIAAGLTGDNDPADGIFVLKILAFPKTLAQETAEIILRYVGQSTFVGNAGTTAGDIIDYVEAAIPAMKITAAQNGYLTLNDQPLEENKNYCYEYEIKPLTAGTKDKLTGMTASSYTAMSDQPFLGDTYYVTNTYYEDFQDHTINDFFTADSGPIGRYGAYGCNYNEEVGTSGLTFTVPAGKKAIVSFDYSTYYQSSYYWRSGVYIDGERFYAPYPGATDRTWRHYTHYKILSEGMHSISCASYDDSGWMMIDSLKVEILSSAKPALRTTFSTQESDEKGWLKAEGSFETPNGNISYGAQASSYYIGGLPAAITDYFQPKKYGTRYPRTIEYYQTVPSGYLQMGFAYPNGTGNVYDDETNNYTIAGFAYKMFYHGTISPGEKIFLGVQPAGTYTHTAQVDDKYDYATIPRFDLITYPVNAATMTGNISFDDSFTKYYFPKERTVGNTSLNVYFPKGDYLIKNLKIYYIESGHKIYMQNKALAEASDLSGWTLSSGLTASMITEETEKADDEPIKIYKKGEKVLYNIFYSDYETDPSKTQYWVYQHINWPPDSVHPDVGKVLNQSIDRFYLSGKYTVTHWQLDNTQRTGTAGDASPYNKESNKVDLVFYVDGGGDAPWVTYIKTNPKAVKENNTYTIAVGVDDTEKDALKLETEVYLNGKRVHDHIRENLKADADGNYPETLISGLPAAKPGVYQVICTVSDYGGTGIKSYKFTVVSDGKVTGFVNHTDQWDANRKKYNLKRFSEEVNRTLQLNDYIAMSTPRMRGTNVFWSGEKFMLRAETEGEPERVAVVILSRDAQGGLKSTGYSGELKNTGRKTSAGAGLWEGSLWNAAMINKWGRKAPEELVFRFTAHYPENVAKTHAVSVIMDSDRDYWQLHRLW
jgi:hypothetical protein